MRMCFGEMIGQAIKLVKNQLKNLMIKVNSFADFNKGMQSFIKPTAYICLSYSLTASLNNNKPDSRWAKSSEDNQISRNSCRSRYTCMYSNSSFTAASGHPNQQVEGTNLFPGGPFYNRPLGGTAQPSSEVSLDEYPNTTNTKKSNELLYMVLGTVLGGMKLLLIVLMAMCAWRQPQKNRMMGECLHCFFCLTLYFFSRNNPRVTSLFNSIVSLVSFQTHFASTEPI